MCWFVQMWQEFVVNIIATPGKTATETKLPKKRPSAESHVRVIVFFHTQIWQVYTRHVSPLIWLDMFHQSSVLSDWPAGQGWRRAFCKHTCLLLPTPAVYYPVCQFHQQIRICKNTTGPHRETGEEFWSHTFCRRAILPTVKWRFCAICQWAKLDSLKRSYY